VTIDLPPSTVILLDACSLINLYATGRLSEMLSTVPARFVVSDIVLRESLYVRRGGIGDDADEREPIELQPILDVRLLEVVVSDDDDESMTFIDLTALIDEGEAMSIALAMHRGWFVMTDDRKARRLLLEREIACFSSLELVRHWSIAVRPAPLEVQVILRAIEQRARWVPWRTHPLAEWWKQSIDSDA
jgi:predicted nucleic acid-binding protein